MGESNNDSGTWKAVALLAGAVLLFACAGSFSRAEAKRAHPERIPVRFWHMWTAEWKVVVERICTRFNESQDRYEVIPLSVPPGNADAKFMLAVAGGDPPDVMAQWNQVIPNWAEAGLIVPLDELMQPEELQRFNAEAYPIVRKIGSYKNRLYGITTGLNIWACYYRPDHVRAAGLDPDHFPETMDELVQWEDKLVRFDAGKHLQRMAYQPGFYTLYPALYGGGFYDDATGRLQLNTPQNRAALEFLVERRSKFGFDEVVRFESGLNASYGMDWPFISGAYSIAVDGQWRVEQIAKFAPNLEYRTAPIPPPRGGKKHATWSCGNFMIVPSGAKQPQGALEFIKFWSGIANPERAGEFYTWGGWLPLSPAVAASSHYRKYLAEHPQFKVFLEILPSEDVQPTPPVPYQMFLWDRISQAEQSAVRGTLSPADALARLDREMTQELARRKELGHDD